MIKKKAINLLQRHFTSMPKDGQEQKLNLNKCHYVRVPLARGQITKSNPHEHQEQGSASASCDRGFSHVHLARVCASRHTYTNFWMDLGAQQRDTCLEVYWQVMIHSLSCNSIQTRDPSLWTARLHLCCSTLYLFELNWIIHCLLFFCVYLFTVALLHCLML